MSDDDDEFDGVSAPDALAQERAEWVADQITKEILRGFESRRGNHLRNLCGAAAQSDDAKVQVALSAYADNERMILILQRGKI